MTIRGRHRAPPPYDTRTIEPSVRALYGVFVLMVGILLLTLGAVAFIPELSPPAYVIGGACIASAIYEFTAE
jgi:hypothetical protein